MARARWQQSPARIVAVGLGVTAIFALVLAFATSATAALRFMPTAVSAEVMGNLVTVSATISSSAPVVAQRAGICVRDGAGTAVAFPLRTNVAVSASATTLRTSALLPAGSYSYQPCVKIHDSWSFVGEPKRFAVTKKLERAGVAGDDHSSGETAQPVAPVEAAPKPPPAAPPAPVHAAPPGPSSGVAMPVGNVPGWTQTFTEDFTAPLARGGFPGPYANKWNSYDGFKDTFGIAQYDKSIISAQNGYLDLFLHTQDGIARTAAPVPLVTGKWGGQVYGRFSVRMRADPLPGYKTAFLLWSDVDNWADGEIDFPEAAIAESADGHNHCVGNPTKSCYDLATTVRYADWHTYTIDWTPTKLSFYVDTSLVGSTTNNIPTKPLHWVLQVESNEVVPSPDTAGHLLIDWATVYRYTP